MTSDRQGARTALGHLKWRADIDGIRAVAVLSVVLFHAFPRQFQGGYVGVDIFFVISGFLISSIIFSSLDQAKFSFVDFYARRVRRIFPALLLVLASCYVLGWHILLADEFEELGKEIAGGAGFVSNLLLWGSAGYFDREAEQKPLLHLWSLAVEEQFYMVWPLVLWIAWKRSFNFLAVTLSIAIVSFFLNIYLIQKDAVATFYWPMTRFWELLAGAALAYLMRRRAIFHATGDALTGTRLSPVTISNVLSLAGVALLAFSVLLLNRNSVFPGYWALLPVLGTVLLIAAGEQAWINKYVLSHKLMVWIGLISYPLYLWHWPLLVFPYIVEVDEPRWEVRTGAVVLSVVLAWLTYKLVETPIRKAIQPRRFTLALSTGVMLMAALGLTTFYNLGMPTRAIAERTIEISAARQDKYYREPGFENNQLDLSQVHFEGKKEDAVLFLGDSLMAHYFSRVEQLYTEVSDLPEYSATIVARPGCRPVPQGNDINSRGRLCDEFYKAVISLAEAEKYRRIVLSANWSTVFAEGVYKSIADAFMADLKKLQQMNKDIIFISMAPFSPVIDPSRLAESLRKDHLSGRNVTLDGDRWIDRSNIDFLQQPRGVRMREFVKALGANLIDPFDTFCTAEKCIYVDNGAPLFRDGFHIRASIAQDYAGFIDSMVGAPLVQQTNLIRSALVPEPQR